MVLTKVKNYKVLNLPGLIRVVLRIIYEPEKVPSVDYDVLEYSVKQWRKHLDLRKEIGYTAIDEENEINLQCIGKLLLDNRNGVFDKRKEMFKEKGIDWRKFHRLPEAYKPVDFIKAKYEHSLLPKEEQ